MLKLQNIHIQLSSRLLTSATRKHLRISVGNIVRTTTQPSKFINQQSLQWNQSMQFPLLYNKQFLFEIFDTHQFGYNPNQLQGIMEGKIVIDSMADNKGTWEVFDSQGKNIGFLSADIVSKVPAMVRSMISNTKIKQQNPQQPQQERSNAKIFRIKSMVSRTPNIILRKAYILVEVGNQSVKTTQLRSRAGELVFIEPRQISLEPNDTDARIKIISIRGEDQEQVVAEGMLQLIGSKPSKKVILMKQGQEVGQIYIQSKIGDKNQINNISFVSNANEKQKQGNTEAFTYGQDIEQSGANVRAKSISPSKSNDFTKLQHFGIQNNSRLSSYRSPNILDSSILSASSVRRRNSVLHQNNNVMFPKEKRFMIYQDRQNQRVTYLNQRSFQFRSERSGARYRGASIGYGGKTDFTKAKRNNPGVGNYRLPSIWDRY